MVKKDCLVAESKETINIGREIINIGDDGDQEAMVGRISRQQVKVFAMFSAAFFMTGLAYAFSLMGDTRIAVAAMMTVLAFVAAIFSEARSS
jgi:hypothetical protein